ITCTARFSPLQLTPLFSASLCSNPAHWQNPYSTHIKRHAGLFPAERRFSLGVCTRTERLIQSQDKGCFQPYKTANHLFCGCPYLRTSAFLFAQRQRGTSLASVVMIAVMLPCFLFAMYEKHGQPLEVVAKHIIQTKFIAPKERPYQTQNLYAVLERQRKLEKEVSAIAKGTYKKGSGKKKRRG